MPLIAVALQKANAEDESFKQEIERILNNKTERQVCVAKVIPDQETAIAVAEPILFKIYGRNQILREKPYVVHLVAGYWFLSGSLPKGWLGGTFEIILSAKDGRVIRLIRGK
jgi:hypothetical protein